MIQRKLIIHLIGLGPWPFAIILQIIFASVPLLLSSKQARELRPNDYITMYIPTGDKA